MSRCLGSLPAVALFSEINPQATKLFPAFDPMYQDREWVKLLQESDYQEFRTLDLGVHSVFGRLVERLYTRSRSTGRRLILRDYNYIDFIGLPFIETPPRRLSLLECLPPAVELCSIAFVRHPVDQWASLCKHSVVADLLTPGYFCDSYAEFLSQVDGMAVYRYEDFLREPRRQLERMCSDLDLPFDEHVLARFAEYRGVTGDLSRLEDRSIENASPRSISREHYTQFLHSRSYASILDNLGYAEPRTRVVDSGTG